MQSSRRSDRKEVSFPATVSFAGRKIRDVVSNVSPTGLYLQSDRHRYRLGDKVRISFSLPISGKLVPVTVNGKIARVVRDALHRTKGIGVQLIAPAPNVTATIGAYLEAKAGGAGRGARPECLMKKAAPGDSELATAPGLEPEDARLAREPTVKYQLDEDEDLTDPAGAALPEEK